MFIYRWLSFHPCPFSVFSLVGRQDRFPRNLCGGWISLTLLDGSCFNIYIRFKGIRH